VKQKQKSQKKAVLRKGISLRSWFSDVHMMIIMIDWLIDWLWCN
jgi:hypothetical protein